MREPLEASGGDYEVLWEQGKVVFFEAQSGTVTASFSYPTTSTFYIRPRPGYVFQIEDCEADFSADAVQSDSLIYAVWAYIPQYGQMVCVKQAIYKRMSQVSTEARGAYPTIDAVGATAEERALPLAEFRLKSRGMKTSRQGIPFRFGTRRDLSSKMHVELRVSTGHDRELGGEHCTMTFYGTEVAET
jgi:hypothetical protein